MEHSTRLSPNAGIAIGPILFVLAILGVLAAVVASGGSDYQVASNADRITADLVAQSNLIRNTISQCNLQYLLAVSTGSVLPVSDPFPASDTTNGTAVSALTCASMGSGSLWGAILFPQPTGGFAAWNYINASSTGGGRCIWTAPTMAQPLKSTATVSGLTRAASKFNSATSYSAGNPAEVLYNPTSTAQKFVVWITTPSGTPDSHCVP